MKLGYHRNIEPRRQRRRLVFKPEPLELDPRHQHRRPGGGESLEDFPGARRQRLLVDGRRRHFGHRRAGDCRHIARDLDIDRQRQAERGIEHPGDFAGRGRGVVEPGAGAGDVAVDLHLAVQRLALMVQQQTAPQLVGAGRAGDHHQRALFRIGAVDRVDQIERAGAIGDRGDPQGLADPRRRIRREADPRLVAQGVQRQDARLLDHLEKRQRKIAGNAENMFRAAGLERVQKNF